MKAETESPSNRLRNLGSLAKKLNIHLPVLSSTKLLTKQQFSPDRPFVDFTKKDMELTDRQWWEQTQKAQQKYTNLWNAVGNITNHDLTKLNDAIMALTMPVQSKLEDQYQVARLQYDTYDKQLHEDYLQLHEQYEKLKKLKGEQSKMDQKRKIMLKQLKQKNRGLLSSELYALLPDQEEYNKLADKVDIIKKEILEHNKQTEEKAKRLKKVRKVIKGIQRELVIYFKQALKNGSDFRQHGIIWIIERLVSLGVDVKSADLPSILDEKSKIFLLDKSRDYANRTTMRKSMESVESQSHINTLPLINSQRTNVSGSLSFIGVSQPEQFGLHIGQRRMKKVYFNTKKCIDEIIKERHTSLNVRTDESTRVRHTVVKSEDRNLTEYHRVLTDYPRQTYQKAHRMLFGFDRSFLK